MENIKFKIAITSHKIYKKSDLKRNEYNRLVLFDKYLMGEESDNHYSPVDNYSWSLDDEFMEICVYNTDFEKINSIIRDITNGELNYLPKYLPIRFLKRFKESEITPIYYANNIRIYLETNQLNSKYRHYGSFEKVVK